MLIRKDYAFMIERPKSSGPKLDPRHGDVPIFVLPSTFSVQIYL
jgi:hypothetical protein